VLLADLADVDTQPSPPAPTPDSVPSSVAPVPAPLEEAPAVEAGPELKLAEPLKAEIPVASAAPLAQQAPAAEPPGLPLQFLNQLLQKLGATRLQSLADLLPAARLLALAALAGIALRLTGATLGAINEIPLLGGLLELVGLVALLNFLARNAFKQQKRAELLERIRQLRRNLIS
jgi:hypothetical protein